jgi:hypothetical protein
MHFDVAPAFFLLGALAALIKADLKFPPALYQSLTLFLLVAIGLKGGVALAAHGNSDVILEALAVVALGVVLPLFGGMFHGLLALFLLQLGVVAASRLAEIRLNAPFVIAFAVLMPLIGATLGALLGDFIGFSVGGVILLAVLGGSASYIAVPAVMQSALPNANHSLSIAASLGVTFPFNVLVGIPLYIALITYFKPVT